jgi:hypothetical protein
MKSFNLRTGIGLVLLLLVVLVSMLAPAWGQQIKTQKAVIGAGGIYLKGGLLHLQTAAGVDTATIAGATGNTSIGGTLAVTGELTGTGPKFYASVPISLTANATTSTGVFVAHRAMTITKASVAFVTKPGSAAGTITFALANYDLSATTDDNLLSTATIDLEGLTAKTTTDLTLTTTAADKVLADGDFIYATIVSNNADATGGGGVLTIEYTLQ